MIDLCDQGDVFFSDDAEDNGSPVLIQRNDSSTSCIHFNFM